MSIFRRLVDRWASRRDERLSWGLRTASRGRLAALGDTLKVTASGPGPVPKPCPKAQSWRVPPPVGHLGRHRRREPDPVLPSRQPPRPGGTDWWLWHGARLIVERHHEHPDRPGICGFCSPATTWPCIAVDTASRADAMSRLMSAGMWHTPEPPRRYRRAQVPVRVGVR